MRLPRLHIPPMVNLFLVITGLWIEGAGFALFMTWWAYDTPKGADIRPALPFADAMIILFTLLLSAYQVYSFKHPDPDEDEQAEQETGPGEPEEYEEYPPALGIVLGDIQRLAAQLGIAYAEDERTFDLDTPESAAWEVHGTYRMTQAGMSSAYGDLRRYQEHNPTPAGYCPGCGHPIAEHPRGLGLACDTWYTAQESEGEQI